MRRHQVQARVNDTTRQAWVEPRRTLADMLRDDLALTGTHVGCEHGVCGACTVLVNGLAVRSCLMLAVQAHGSEILTIEGLADGSALHPVQQAFFDSHSFQCGFCTPGFVMSTVALLAGGRQLTDSDIREALSGNICRCTGYQTIVDGVRLAAERLREQTVETSAVDAAEH
jgi:carbon-monoxide dehydrogenase small subunit